ncbi:piggyBac transposable element-derived protein 4-like [Oscarella lobularis]|uniref:piggyBac transposable element-derived protein 4-like n=1 Tax=Oscarella lobularis TaxID=121494 RepID=UPI00331438D5
MALKLHFLATPVLFAFSTEEIWDMIVANTNNYAEWKRGQSETVGRPWAPVTKPEMKAFIGVTILMGILKFPRLEDYWQESCKYLRTDLAEVFSSVRYQQISRFLHISDRTQDLPRNPGDESQHDRLQKVRPLIDHCGLKFKDLYQVGKHITVDEAMIPFKGKWGIKQYMKDKPHKWEIKAFVLADATNGYITRFFIYTKKSVETQYPEVGLCTQAVLDLVEDFHHKGPVLYTDNYYTSPDLYMTLHGYDIYATGTLRISRKGCPKELAKSQLPTKSRVRRGFYKHLSKGPLTAGVWFDRRYVYFLSTSHLPSLPDFTIATTERRDGARKVDVLCPPP